MNTSERELRWLLKWALEQLEQSVDSDTGLTLEEMFSSPTLDEPVAYSRFKRAVELSGYANEEERKKAPCQHTVYVTSIHPDADGNVFECWSCGKRAAVKADGKRVWREAH